MGESANCSKTAMTPRQVMVVVQKIDLYVYRWDARYPFTIGRNLVGKVLTRLASVAVVACLMLSVAAHADGKEGKGIKMHADLSAAQETSVGPGFIESANITAKFNSDLSAVEVKLKVKGGGSVAGAHFHCARPGTNGPLPFGLFGPGPLTFDGAEAKGTLTNADFTGADCTGFIGRPVTNIAALAFAMRDGLIYINVHTVENPGGEVRGQMLD